MDVVKLNAVCDGCGEAKAAKAMKGGDASLPMGWKRLKGQVFCRACWNKRYCIRAVTITVASCEWSVVSPAMRDMANAVRCLTNWSVRKMLQSDCVRGPGDVKMPAPPKIDLYKLGPECEAWPLLPKGSAVQVLHAVMGKYRARRYEAIWTGKESLPVSRHPLPIPFRASQVAICHREERYRISVPLGPGRDNREELTLAGGHNWRRQHRDLDWLIENPDLLCEAVVLEKKANGGDHRHDSGKRDNGNGERRSTRMMVKVVGWFPVRQKVGDNVLSLRTEAGALLVGYDRKADRVWTYNADHAKRIVNRHSWHMGQLSRLSDDRKAERRKPQRESKGYRAMLQARSSKDGNRLTSLCHEVTASAVSFAVRRDCGKIIYDDSDRRFSGSFPWSKLRTMLDQKCRANGVTLVLASGDVAEKSTESLAAE